MSKEIKMVGISAVVIVIGAILVDCGIMTTGAVLMLIGFVGFILGPLMVNHP